MRQPEQERCSVQKVPRHGANSSQTVLCSVGASLVNAVAHAYQASNAVLHVLKNLIPEGRARESDDCAPDVVAVDSRDLNNADLRVSVMMSKSGAPPFKRDKSTLLGVCSRIS